jgi:hypothetical protein
VTFVGASAYLTSTKKAFMGIEDSSPKPAPQVVKQGKKNFPHFSPHANNFSAHKTLDPTDPSFNVVPAKTVSTKTASTPGKPTMESTRKGKAVVSKEIMAKSIRRLMLDLQEIQKHPLETVTAHPLESDVFECIITAISDLISD